MCVHTGYDFVLPSELKTLHKPGKKAKVKGMKGHPKIKISRTRIYAERHGERKTVDAIVDKRTGELTFQAVDD
jgi:hypothetical protein